jgi:hypothetical protein
MDLITISVDWQCSRFSIFFVILLLLISPECKCNVYSGKLFKPRPKLLPFAPKSQKTKNQKTRNQTPGELLRCDDTPRTPKARERKKKKGQLDLSL